MANSADSYAPLHILQVQVFKKSVPTVHCSKLMSAINIYLPEVLPCLATQNYTNGSTRCHAFSYAQQTAGFGLGVVVFSARLVFDYCSFA